MILAIGNAGTYEMEMFQSVLRAIRARGSDAVLFKQDRCLEGEAFAFEVRGGQPACSVMIDGVQHNVNDFSGLLTSCGVLAVYYGHGMAELTAERFEEGMESFAKIVKEGFDAVDQRFDAVEFVIHSNHEEVKQEIHRLDGRIGKLADHVDAFIQLH